MIKSYIIEINYLNNKFIKIHMCNVIYSEWSNARQK